MTNHVAVLGFTSHKAKAPFNDPSWEFWGLNDLYLDLPQLFQQNGITTNRIRWFQLHSWQTVTRWGDPGVEIILNPSEGPPHPRDPNHLMVLKEMANHFPVYLRDPPPEYIAMPNVRVFPRQEVMEAFQFAYYTNSITWMIGLAILELTDIKKVGKREVRVAKPGAKLGVYGVDMMVAGGPGSEYGYQRPSCEWLIGVAQAAGIEVYIPEEADLMKSAYQYGDEDEGYFRTRLMAHRNDLKQALGFAQQQSKEAENTAIAMLAKIEEIDWIMRAHLPGDGGAITGTAPRPDAHKVLPGG